MTDHILEINWEVERGWLPPVIKEQEPFTIDPGSGVLHYATQCFEGLKAYPHVNGRDITLFRPELNLARFRESCRYLALPDFDPYELQLCLMELLRQDHAWMPRREKHSIYVRPTAISLDESLHLRRPTKARIFVILSPTGHYFPSGFQPVRLYCTSKAVRAWPKGHGDKKLGGNYGPVLYPLKEIQHMEREVDIKGNVNPKYANMLWLVDDYVTEVGVTNFFLLWKNMEGEKELITPSLDGSILPGIVRRSIIELSREWGEFKVTERKLRIQEII